MFEKVESRTLSRIAGIILLSGTVGVAADSHIVVDVETGAVLLSHHPDEPRQVASLTKVATVLLALQWLDDAGESSELQIVVSAEAVSGGVNPLALRAGDSFSLQSAMYAAMMASDNTSAYAIAEHIGSKMSEEGAGSQAVDKFVEEMNRLARAKGLTNTRFVNPHGLDEGETLGFSTSADMALLTMVAIGHPGFLSLCCEAEREINVIRGGTEVVKPVKNTNALVGSRGIDGVKTGTTGRSGPCLIASATGPDEAPPSRLVSVVLNAEDRFKETVLLLNQGWEALDTHRERGNSVANRRLLRPLK